MALPADPSGRGPSTLSFALRGVVALVVVLLVATALLLQSRGVFRDDFPATAIVGNVGDGLPIGSDVKHRGVLVGRVGDVRVDSTGQGRRHVIRLDIKPEHAGGIPAAIKARIIPTNIFGAPSVDLVSSGPDTVALARDATIPGDDSQETLQLQTALSKIRDVVSAVQPAKLNTALTNIADALDGRGKQIGELIGRLDSYVSALNPHAATFQANLESLATALEGLQANAPALLDTVDNVLASSRTLVEKQHQLAATLAGGATAVDTVNSFLEANGERAIKVVQRGAAIVDTVADDSAEVPRAFDNLGRVVATLGSTFSGPHQTLNIDLIIGFSPFEPYTAADCPRYPGMSGPNCGQPVPARTTSALPPSPVPAPAPAQATPTAPPTLPGLPTLPDLPGLPVLPVQPGQSPFPQLPLPTLPGGMVGPVGSQQETDLFNAILGGYGGDLGSLLLGPILRGTTVVMPQ